MPKRFPCQTICDLNPGTVESCKMESFILCTYMSVCTTIVSETNLGVYNMIWNSAELRVASEKQVIDLANYLDTTELTIMYKIGLHNSEAITKVILEALDPIQDRVNRLKAEGKNSTNCLVAARNNVKSLGSEAFDNMKPCVQTHLDVFKSIKENVDKLKTYLKEFVENALRIFETCHTQFNEKSCLNLEMGKLNTTADKLTKAVQDVQTNGNAALEAASQANKACLVPHSNALRQNLKLVEEEAKACLDAL